jgi:uncharacterized sporulation protein YeaH/YhbH (DUF444 family)
MAPPKNTTELQNLRCQVQWLEQQLQGHEDNFGKQIDKINGITSRMEDMEKDLLTANQQHTLDEAKIASLSSYIDAIGEAPLLKVLRPAYRKELRRIAAITAFEASAYRAFFEELRHLVEMDVPAGEEHAIVAEAQNMIVHAMRDIDFHRRKISESI